MFHTKITIVLSERKALDTVNEPVIFQTTTTKKKYYVLQNSKQRDLHLYAPLLALYLRLFVRKKLEQSNPLLWLVSLGTKNASLFSILHTLILLRQW